MSTALTTFLTTFNNLIGDNLSGTTDGDGETDNLTFVDSALSKYEDGYFGDPGSNPEWWAYIGTTLRTIKSSQGSSGTIIVHKAFGSQIMSGTAYGIHHFDREKKFVAINQALNDAYPWFYKRVEDESTLKGTGAGANKYEVPNTFTEFPDQIWKKYESGTKVTYTEIIDYDVKQISDKMYFYANITTDYPILLVGKTYLSQFTNDISTTELTSGQADVVCFLAVCIFYRMLSSLVDASDSGRFNSLAGKYENMWEQRKNGAAMPLILPRKINYGWLDE